MSSFSVKAVVGAAAVAVASAHGRMTVPAARNAVWKDGPTDAIKMNAIPNYNLDGLAAGGPGVTPNGHGLCGDALDGPQDHMAGGKFGRTKTGFEPAIVGSYTPGQTFDVQVVLTAHHDGFFEWRLCDPAKDGVGPAPFQVTQSCFDKHVLQLADATQGMRKSEWKYYGPKYANRAQLWDENRSQSLSKWKVPSNTPWNINRYTIKLRMPMDVSCERCVVQWYYQTGNSDGAYPEEFWNCADVEVLATPLLNITPEIIKDGDSGDDPNGVLALGKCGLSGQPNGMKCFSKDVRVTDQWCDKLKCDLAFASMCGNFNVDAECAPLAPITRAGQLPPTPVPAPSQWESSWDNGNSAGTNTNSGGNSGPAPMNGAPAYTGGGGGGGAVVSTGGGASNYNYNFWANNWNYNSAPASGSGGGSGGSGGKTVTTTTSTTTSTYH